MPENDEAQRIRDVYRAYGEQARYRQKWSSANRGNQAIIREWRTGLARLLREHGHEPLGVKRVLEVGCGGGGILAGLCELGATPENLVGVDLLPDRIAAARKQFPKMRFEQVNAEELPFADAAFDLVLVFTVFTSVLDPGMSRSIAAQVTRVLKPGGAVVWYDFRFSNPWNPHVRGMPASVIRSLFPGLRAELRSLTLLPPLARRLGPLTFLLYPLLARIPFLRTHYLGLLIKPAVPGMNP